MKRFLLIVLLASSSFAEEGGIRVVSWPSAPVSAQVATVSVVSVSNAGAVTLLAARSGRLKIILFNEKEALYIKAGAGATITDYSWKIAAATPLEINAYSGVLTAVLGV